MSFFERFLTVWVIICMGIGVFIGKYIPFFPNFLNTLEYANVSIPIAVLLFLIIYPMMLKVDFQSIINAGKNTKGITITTATNWLIQPFSMYLIALLFFNIIFKSFIDDTLAREYLIGAVLLGTAPCTAMVFVWSRLTLGSPAYTLVQVAINDLILLFAYVPIVSLLLGISGIIIPYNTLILSVILFIVIPLILAIVSRKLIIKKKGKEYLEKIFISNFDKTTIIGLLLTLVIIFSFQGEKLLLEPFHILLIAIPLTIQTFFIFFVSYIWGYKWKIPHNIISSGSMIAASNFFELAVAVAISLFGLNSGVTLVTVVGLLVEVPTMLILVKICNLTRAKFSE